MECLQHLLPCFIFLTRLHKNVSPQFTSSALIFLYRLSGAVIKGYEQDVGTRTSFYGFTAFSLVQSILGLGSRGFQHVPLGKVRKRNGRGHTAPGYERPMSAFGRGFTVPGQGRGMSALYMDGTWLITSSVHIWARVVTTVTQAMGEPGDSLE